ncbi:serine hydrolase [Aquabacterium sp.]|uniref:serine hydrolase domain-containing protein n=1 Tax=Aquabacterium sp. TaxID=1872578 RepID=UPI0025C1C58D|nr:serine hydrolase [Aquabacterium sp.]
MAVYRPGAGCTLLTPDVDRASWEASAPRSGPVLPPLTAAQRATPWPLGEGAPEPLHAGSAQAQALQQVSDALFDEPATDPKTRQNTLAVLVVKDGRLVHERYAQGYGPGMPLLGWSMTKTVTALWAGVALGEGLLALDDALPVPAWQGSHRPPVRWRDALQMASGVDWFEGHAGFSDVSNMVFGQPDEGAFVEAKPMAATPGTRFNYATGDSALLARSLKRVLGDDAQRAHDHQVASLFTPLGMRGAFVEADVAGTPSGGSRAVLRPRDWLKLGQLILQDGQWQGVQRIPASYIRFMRTPSPANPGYGGQLWLHQPADMPPGMPTDVAYFSGLMGQYVVMVPSQKLIVLRMGVSFDKDETRRRVFQATQRLSRAFSEPERGLASLGDRLRR